MLRLYRVALLIAVAAGTYRLSQQGAVRDWFFGLAGGRETYKTKLVPADESPPGADESFNAPDASIDAPKSAPTIEPVTQPKSAPHLNQMELSIDSMVPVSVSPDPLAPTTKRPSRQDRQMMMMNMMDDLAPTTKRPIRQDRQMMMMMNMMDDLAPTTKRPIRHDRQTMMMMMNMMDDLAPTTKRPIRQDRQMMMMNMMDDLAPTTIRQERQVMIDELARGVRPPRPTKKPFSTRVILKHHESTFEPTSFTLEPTVFEPALPNVNPAVTPFNQAEQTKDAAASVLVDPASEVAAEDELRRG